MSDMKELNLPEPISRFLKQAQIKLVMEGQSAADVYQCCDLKNDTNYYLKIEKWNHKVEKEHTLYQWLHKEEKLPVPAPVFSIKEGDIGYLLLEEAKGEILRADKYYADPPRLARLAAEGIKMLGQTDISDCPADGQVAGKIKLAGEQLCPDSTELDPSVPYTKDFSTRGELFEFLKENQPEENLVFTHGDYCLNNFFTDGKKLRRLLISEWGEWEIGIRILRCASESLWDTARMPSLCSGNIWGFGKSTKINCAIICFWMSCSD